ncbi:SDR family oxidoreductase [Mucilaginibacter sp.]|uniref:SDR family oxidoreductase n=1 Tax=Mucilaginibacter sp. TaxID=1882438 RepID=UPI0025FE0D63|nr:SDR family oxidoreductase [Mucilaginibacter sp.]
MKKTILITGASSGFGLLLANNLHKKGFNVIGTSREPQKYAGKVPFKLLALDIADPNSISTFQKELSQVASKIDVLVNNAGYMLMGLAEETPVELGRKQFETNFWGTVNITNALLPIFRKQRSGQIITISSIVGLIGPPGLSYYTASKHALEGYFKSLRFELKQFNVNVSMIEPLWFKTGLGEHSEGAKGNISDYDTFRNKVNTNAQKSMEAAPGPEAVVAAMEKLIATKEPKMLNPVGKMSGMIVFLQNYAPKMYEGSIMKDLK